MRTETHTEVAVEGLNHLIEANRDSEEGFAAAAEAVRDHDQTLHTLLHRYSLQRARFAGDLEQEVRTYGGEPSEEGTTTGTLRRGWLNLRAALTGGKETAILAECEHAEQSTLHTYEAALRADLPEYLKETIRQQHDEILEALQHIRALREARSSK